MVVTQAARDSLIDPDRIPFDVFRAAARVGILRLRGTIREAGRAASLRMTDDRG